MSTTIKPPAPGPLERQEPFVTGSQAYGVPREDSDIDLVVAVPDELRQYLASVCDNQSGRLGQRSMRFGRLNLLCATTPEQYEAWHAGTTELLSEEESADRDHAREVIGNWRQRLGVDEHRNY